MLLSAHRRALAHHLGTAWWSFYTGSMSNDASFERPGDDALVATLRSRDDVGALIVGAFSAVLAFGLWLSQRDGVISWAASQLLLGVAFVQWFVLLHEAGHGTLCTSRRANVVVGHVANFVALIPFHSWQPIHQQHHIWAGFQETAASRRGTRACVVGSLSAASSTPAGASACRCFRCSTA